jgi:hypothetical protein
MKDFAGRAARLFGDVIELVRGGRLRAYFNLADKPAPLPPGASKSHAVLFSSESTRHGGPRRDLNDLRELLPHECVVIGPADWPVVG